MRERGLINRILRWQLCASLACLLATAGPVYAQPDNSLELAIKATFLYKFVPFVQWPATAYEAPSAPFNLCVVGEDRFGDLVAKGVAGKSIGSHPISLHHLATANVQAKCHLMFIAGSPAQSVEEALQIMRGRPTLTVTDSEISSAPGIVHFLILKDRVNFNIDAAAADESNLLVSSKLKALAHQVNTASKGGQ